MARRFRFLIYNKWFWINNLIMKKLLKPLLYVNFKVNVQEGPSSRDSGPFINTKFNLASLWLTLYNPAAACWPVASAMAWRWVLSPAFSCQRSFPRHTRPPRTKMGINMSFIISWDLNFTKDSHNLQGHSCYNLGSGQRCMFIVQPCFGLKNTIWAVVKGVHRTTLLWTEEHNLGFGKRRTSYNPALDWRTQFGQCSKVYIVQPCFGLKNTI